MLDKTLRFIKKFIPRRLFEFAQPFYHYKLALFGALIYRFPAKKLHIIGITGTKGKSTTVELINSILEEAGYKTAVSNTIRFKIDEESRPNKYKMSMPGRFFMQKFLRQAVDAGCTHAVVEITSEGSKQFRHKFIYLDYFIFTNLSPEHIEAHGSYEKYREAKLRIIKNLVKKNGMLIVNADDDEADTFLNYLKLDKNLTYSLSDIKPIKYPDQDHSQTEMQFKKTLMHSNLPGEFNVYNALAAATVTDQMGIDLQIIKKGIENLKQVPGRVQKIKGGQDFDVVVDYAHTPESLEELYKAFPNQKKVCVLGNTGGGRDTWKRPVMAGIAEEYCDQIIFTNEDPYDEDPKKIVKEMHDAVKSDKAEIIMDRRQAINSALKKANYGDIVLISGKGTDPYIMGPKGTQTPWSDAQVVEEELGKIISNK